MMKRNLVKNLCIIVCALLVFTVTYFAFAFFGNPVSSCLAKRNTERILRTQYADSDFKAQKVSYNFKTGGYYAYIISPSSQDSYFTIYFDGLGRYRYDTYDHITSGDTTFSRLHTQYWELVDEKLSDGCTPFDISIVFGDLRSAEFYEIFNYTDANGKTVEYILYKDYGLDPSALELDKEYDITQLGRNCGNICLYIHDPQVTVERAAELLLEVKVFLDEQGIPYHAMDFNLCEPRNEEGQIIGEQITLFDFLYTDIYEEGLVDRVQQHWDAAREHFAIQDAETAKFIEKHAKNQENT